MPVLEHDKLIKEYWESVKHKYPGMTFQQFNAVCKTPAEYIKDSIRSDNLPIILIKYLGKIRPYSSTIQSMLKFFRTKIDQPVYKEKVERLEKYLEKLKIYDRKTQEVIIGED